MKFDNLVFVDHPIIKEAIMAKVRLNNGTIVSVVCGEGLYSSSKAGLRKACNNVDDAASFEVMIGDEVSGWQGREEIDLLMAKAELEDEV